MTIRRFVWRCVVRCLSVVDILLIPFVFLSAKMYWWIRRLGIGNFPISRAILRYSGVMPIWRHYYEPLFDPRDLRHSLRQERDLPGLDLNEMGQLAFVQEIARFSSELALVPMEGDGDQTSFHFNNGSYGTGDAEFLYCTIRHKKPRRILEIGSGNSTLIARMAVERNCQEDPAYHCEHTCIEPYEMPWLEKTGVKVLRERIELCSPDYFRSLQSGDLLFIDSSHVIRPQGDVLYEYLHILPILNKGVLVHIHDIFTPRDYLDRWLNEDVKLWNEQYLLEAFLCHNRDYKVVAALNFLQHQYFNELKQACPFIDETREPGSFYMERV